MAPVTCPPLLLMIPVPVTVTPGAVVKSAALNALFALTVSVPAIVPCCRADPVKLRVKVAVLLPKVSVEPDAMFKLAAPAAPFMLSVWLVAELVKVGLVAPLPPVLFINNCAIVCVGTLITVGVPPKVNCNTSVVLG